MVDRRQRHRRSAGRRVTDSSDITARILEMPPRSPGKLTAIACVLVPIALVEIVVVLYLLWRNH